MREKILLQNQLKIENNISIKNHKHEKQLQKNTTLHKNEKQFCVLLLLKKLQRCNNMKELQISKRPLLLRMLMLSSDLFSSDCPLYVSLVGPKVTTAKKIGCVLPFKKNAQDRRAFSQILCKKKHKRKRQKNILHGAYFPPQCTSLQQVP